MIIPFCDPSTAFDKSSIFLENIRTAAGYNAQKAESDMVYTFEFHPQVFRKLARRLQMGHTRNIHESRATHVDFTWGELMRMADAPQVPALWKGFTTTGDQVATHVPNDHRHVLHLGFLDPVRLKMSPDFPAVGTWSFVGKIGVNMGKSEESGWLLNAFLKCFQEITFENHWP